MLDGVSLVTAVIFLVSGAVSGVSWYFAFALGLMRELNNAVGIGVLLSLCFMGILFAGIGTFALRESPKRSASRRRPRAVSTIKSVPKRPDWRISSTVLSRIRAEVLVSVRQSQPNYIT